MTTPSDQQSQQKGVMDAAAARRAALAAKHDAALRAIQQQQAAQQQAQTAAHPSGAVKIALLAPLSGKSAGLGQAMVNAAQLAVFEMGVNQFELMPRDTQGTTSGAAQAAREAIAGGAKLLIGPLFAADVAAVKPIVRESGVNMLALSTDVSLAESGAYVMGFAPAPQVERVVAYAASKGVKNFAAIVPAGPYGQLVSKAFEQAVQKAGGTILVSASASSVDAVLAQKENIEALFLPFGGAELRKIAGQLSAAGFDSGRSRLLGTGLWDEPDLAKESFLVGGWYAAPEPQAREKFMQSYQETYNQSAPRLATLAYDATALAAVIARNGGSFDAQTMCMPSGFTGLDGIFRLLPSGQIERGLAIIEVSSGGTRIVDPSPADFRSR